MNAGSSITANNGSVKHRALIAALVTVVAAGMLAVQFASLPREGGPSAAALAAGPCSVKVLSTAFARPGTRLQRGDLLMLDSMTRDSRVMATQDSSRIGDTYDVVVQRSGRVLTMRESVGVAESPRAWIASAVAKLLIFLAGLFILWRGRDLASLHYGAASVLYSVPIPPLSDSLLAPQLRGAYQSISEIVAVVAAYLFYLTIQDFARGAIPERVLSVSRGAVIACLLLNFADAIGYPIGRARAGCYSPFLHALYFPTLLVDLSITFGLLAATYVVARGVQRQRVKWIFWSTLVGFSGLVVWFLNPSLPAASLTSVLITFGYGYAILRHRVIDVAFVVNRAVVFTLVTTIVFAAFALVASAIERTTLTIGESALVQAGVALALAFSFDFMYKRIENAVDSVFFRDKHRAELLLRRFTEEARFITSATVLLERAAETVRDALKAASVAIYAPRAGGYLLVVASGAATFTPAVDADDPAFVRLRASLGDVDLSEVPNAFSSQGYAFALVVQSRLDGALVCGPRANDEPYDPSERALLRALAREVAGALRVIFAGDHEQLIADLARGTVDPQAARDRAQELIRKESAISFERNS